MIPTLNYDKKTIITSLELDFIDKKNRKKMEDFNNGKQNTCLYIPRVDRRFTEQDISHNLFELGIGTVRYVDFVGTRDQDSNAVLFYSAFVVLEYWNIAHPVGHQAAINAANNIQTKLCLNYIEYWILLPAKKTIPRSKVNIHQLAEYTNELFTKAERLETDLLKQDTKIKELTEMLDQKTDEIWMMTAYYNTALSKFEAQTSLIESLIQKVNILTEHLQPNKDIIEEKPIPTPSVEVEVTVLEPAINKKSAAAMPYCEDECFFFAPLKKQNLEEKEKQDTTSSELPIVTPIIPASTAPKMRSISPENNIRAKNSLNFCGNE